MQTCRYIGSLVFFFIAARSLPLSRNIYSRRGITLKRKAMSPHLRVTYPPSLLRLIKR